MNTPSNKYRKSSQISKFGKIQHYERERAKKGFEKSANFAKIAEVTRIFSFYLKTLSNKYRKRFPNLTKF